MSTQPSEVALATASVTDRGLSDKRPLNEDSFLLDAERRIFVVADGVGGAEAGEVASQTAVEVIDEAFRHRQPDDDIEDLLEIAIQRANASIYQMSREQPRFSMMATTIVALHLDGHRATIGHVGDSRLYRLSPDGQLHRETDDHSIVEEEVRAGRMSPEQAANHPSRNVISRALGAESSVEVDMKTIEVEDGTVFLLCSDGITRHLPDTEISALLHDEPSLEDACAEMKRRCFERGAEDNLTAVTIRVGQPVNYANASPTNADDDERTLIIERPATLGAAAASGAASLRQRLFANAGDSAHADGSASPIANLRGASNAVNRPASNRSAVARAGSWFGALLLVSAASAVAFYGGLRYQHKQDTLAAAQAVAPAPTPTPESAEARYERLRRQVDLYPSASVTRMSNEANGQPLSSNDPEFLYLYGRALMLAGKPQDSLQAFNLALQKLGERASPERDPLKIDARIATAAAALKSNNFAEERAAAKALDDVIELENKSGIAAPATSPSLPSPTPPLP